ncbi:MAG: ABC transporter permease [Firmicutes bacterium]|nr:ABC transporter permease [Bacillota bacterium]
MNRNGIMSFLSSVLVLFVGLLIGFIILLVSNSAGAVSAFTTILTHGAGSMRVFGNVLLHATPIILTGLSVAFAFKTGLFNIGATGQFTLGAFVAVYIGIEFTFLPGPLRILAAVLAAAAVGALWGAIPGLLKAYRNVHEVISCIMTNYIAMFLVNYLVLNNTFDPSQGRSFPPPTEARLPSLGFENIFRTGVRSSNVDAGIVIAIIIAIVIYIILEKTTFGYELKACGFNKDAAKYAGINENRNVVLSMMICGALAGIGGALAYIGGMGATLNIVDVLLPYGFTGISVAFLGLNNPIGVIFSGVLISYLTMGGTQIQTDGFSSEFVDIVIAVIIYFCAFVFLVKTFLGERIDKIFKGKKGEKDGGKIT